MAIERKQKPPKNIIDGLNALNMFNLFWWKSFQELSTCRPVGMSLGSIPWSACLQYSLYHNVNFDELWYIISRLDNVYLKEVNKSEDKK